MISLRKSADRGRFEGDWLTSLHTFSFDTFYDPQHMGFRSLRVINEDRVAPGHGFPLHPHRDMEILSLVLEGTLEHRDDLDHAEQIRAGEVQRITAGSGIMHSEVNPSATEEVHFLQIWIVPRERGLTPGYEVLRLAATTADGLALLASADGRDGSVLLQQDSSIFLGRLAAGGTLPVALDSGRHAWLQLLAGTLTLNGQQLAEGDGAAVSAESSLQLQAPESARFLLFDLA